jgi:hypothetical protein
LGAEHHARVGVVPEHRHARNVGDNFFENFEPLASFIGIGSSPHQSITRLIASSTVAIICSIATSR